MIESKSCLTCKHCSSEQVGYSEYTITGLSFTCDLGKHPNGCWEDRDNLEKYGEQCSFYVNGEPIFYGYGERENK